MSRYRFSAAIPLALAAGTCLGSIAGAEQVEQTLSRAVEPETAKTNRLIFVCPKEALLTVEFVTSDPVKPAVVSTPGGEQLSLPAAESGSGYRYADDTHELRGKGREVTWTDGSKPTVVCTEERPATGGTEPN